MINEPKDIGYNYQVKQKFNFYHMDQVDWNTQFLEIPYRLQILHRWGEQFGGEKNISEFYTWAGTFHKTEKLILQSLSSKNNVSSPE